MSWARIKAILLHSYYHTSHSVETWVDLGWFTFIQLGVFGFLASFFAQGNPEMGRALLLGFLFWEVVRIGQYCVSITLMWEVWSHSLSTMFISPLTMEEFFTSQMISGAIKTLGLVVLLSLTSKFMFGFWIFELGLMSIIYISLLLLFSYAMGIFIAGLIVRYGTDIQSLAWGLIFIFQPLSAVYYPVSALPPALQYVAMISPITYVMESARMQLSGFSPHWNYLLISTFLGLAYFAGSLWFLKAMYLQARRNGSFARLGH
ncbi:MAG TPA: ABC transporter permease [Vitreimonas sp.]|nr:ABC transporter permease [Vitreimonas sp.]